MPTTTRSQTQSYLTIICKEEKEYDDPNSTVTPTPNQRPVMDRSPVPAELILGNNLAPTTLPTLNKIAKQPVTMNELTPQICTLLSTWPDSYKITLDPLPEQTRLLLCRADLILLTQEDHPVDFFAHLTGKEDRLVDTLVYGGVVTGSVFTPSIIDIVVKIKEMIRDEALVQHSGRSSARPRIVRFLAQKLDDVVEEGNENGDEDVSMSVDEGAASPKWPTTSFFSDPIASDEPATTSPSAKFSSESSNGYSQARGRGGRTSTQGNSKGKGRARANTAVEHAPATTTPRPARSSSMNSSAHMRSTRVKKTSHAKQAFANASAIDTIVNHITSSPLKLARRPRGSDVMSTTAEPLDFDVAEEWEVVESRLLGRNSSTSVGRPSVSEAMSIVEREDSTTAQK